MSELHIPKDLKILVVDDVEMMRKLVIKMIAKIGLTNVEEASDGLEALEVITSNLGTEDQIQFVFSDLGMPNLDGLGLLKQIKANSAFSDIPVLIISAEDEIGSIMELTSCGAEDYLVKPFTERDIQDKLLRSLFPDIISPLEKI